MRAKTTPISIAIKVQTNSPSNEGSKLSTLDSYLEIMKFSLRHSLTKQAVSDLLSLVGLHLPHTSMPSFYKFKKFFLDLYEDISFSTHYCCALCHSTLENANAVCSNGCTGMGTPIEFLTVCVEAQLKRRFQGMTFSPTKSCCVNAVHVNVMEPVTCWPRKTTLSQTLTLTSS